jgi:uncharacterized membrane protein YoaK (UPF0700 family)
VAGLVNICGVLALGVLTTNVTGHFAYFAEGVAMQHELFGAYFIFYILSFLAGSFASSFINEYYILRKSKAPNSLAIALEITILLVIGLFGDYLIARGFERRIIACFLLFAMGLQNSLVSKISNSAVRTTHLTGLFTDLGIELSQLFFYKEGGQRQKLLHSISLRLGIVAFFFSGCVIGGFLFLSLHTRTLIVGALVLVLALIYDNIRLRFYRVRKNLQHTDEPQ